MDDTDLSGMTPEEAREYVLAFIKSLKETQRQRQELAAALDLWKGRVELAQRESRPDLAEQASTRLAGIREDLTRLEQEEAGLNAKVEILKDNLKQLPPGWRPSVDADVLLAQLEMLVGERDETSEQIQELQVQSKLEELKRKMQDDKGEE
jgi:phage shock protein A